MYAIIIIFFSWNVGLICNIIKVTLISLWTFIFFLFYNYMNV